MSFWQRPRERNTPTGVSLPLGLVHAEELMDFALPAVWGADFAVSMFSDLPVGLPNSQKLTDALDLGRDLKVAERLKLAAKSGLMSVLEIARQTDGSWSEPERISAGDIASLLERSLVYTLNTGEWDPLAPGHWHRKESHVIAFREDDADRWLQEMTPASALPPLDALNTPAMPSNTVALSAAMAWRAGLLATHWFDVVGMDAELRDLVQIIEAHDRDSSIDRDFERLCIKLADCVAAKIRRQKAGNELVSLMARGRLNAAGINNEASGKLENIEGTNFSVEREVIAHNDMLVPREVADSIEIEIGYQQGVWTNVRIKTHDLLAAYGLDDHEGGQPRGQRGQTTSASRPSTEAPPLTTKPPILHRRHRTALPTPPRGHLQGRHPVDIAAQGRSEGRPAALDGYRLLPDARRAHRSQPNRLRAH
jgi:hypothetical protein